MSCRRTRAEFCASRPELGLLALGQVLLRGLGLGALGGFFLEVLARPHRGPERPARRAAEPDRPALLGRNEPFEGDLEPIEAVEGSGLLHGIVHRLTPANSMRQWHNAPHLRLFPPAE